MSTSIVDPQWGQNNAPQTSCEDASANPPPLSGDRFDVAPVVRAAIEWASAEADRVAVVGISPPGAGKTTALLLSQIRHAVSTGKGFALLMSSHRLAEEKTKQALEIAGPMGAAGRVVHVLGQSVLCPHGKGLAATYRKGYEGRDRNLHGVACGWDGCAYSEHIDGIGSKRIKIATHAHLDFLLDTGRLDGNVVCIDELSALHEDIRLDDCDFSLAAGDHAMRRFQEWLQPAKAASRIFLSALELLEDGARARGKGDAPPFAERLPLAGNVDLLLRAADCDLERLLQVLERGAAVEPASAPSPPGQAIRDNDLRRVPRADLPRFFATVLAELRGEAGPDSGAVACFCVEGHGNEARVWIEWRVRKELPADVSVVLLDATADLTEPLIKKAFSNKDVKPFSKQIQMPGPEEGLHAYYIPHRNLTRRRMFGRKDGQLRITVKGAASIRNVCRRAFIQARQHLPPAPRTAITAPRPATRALADEESILGQFQRLAQAEGYLGKVDSAYHFGLRGLNTLEQARLFINLGDPLKNLGVLREEARLFGMDPDDHVMRTTVAELNQTLHRSRALRVTPDRPKVVVHAGRYPMIDFDFETIELGPGPSRSDRRLADEDLAGLLLEHGGATAPWLVDEVLPLIQARCADARGTLDGPAAALAGVAAPAPSQRNMIWRELFVRMPGVGRYTVPNPRRAVGAPGRRPLWYARSAAVVAAICADFDLWLNEQADSLLPSCCSHPDGTPMEPRGVLDKIPTDVTSGEPVQNPTAAALAAFRMIRRQL